MVLALLLLLIVTVAATYWARHLALHLRRHVAGWMFATAMLPPVVFILWALPKRTSPARS